MNVNMESFSGGLGAGFRPGWRARLLSVTGMTERAPRAAGLGSMPAGTTMLYNIN